MLLLLTGKSISFKLTKSTRILNLGAAAAGEAFLVFTGRSTLLAGKLIIYETSLNYETIY